MTDETSVKRVVGEGQETDEGIACNPERCPHIAICTDVTGLEKCQWFHRRELRVE